MGKREIAPRPPRAVRRPTVLETHGDRRIDPYYWMREKGNPEVIAHLEAENAYTDALMAPTEALQERLFREIVGRVQETDTSAPSYFKGYWSYTRTVEGLDYEIYCRRAGTMHEPEEVLLDGNELAQGHDYFDLGFVDASPDQALLAYAVDYTGAELFELHFRDLAAGADLEDVLTEVHYGAAWAADNRTFFYVKADAAMRPFQVWRHRLGTAADQDVLVLQEDDERFELSVEPTKSERYIIFGSTSQVTAECRFIAADDAEAEPTMIEPRRQGIEYSVDDQEDRFLILTNDGARDFRLMAAPVADPRRASWVEVLPERDGVRINFTDVHKHYIVLGQRSEGLQRLEVLDSVTGATHLVEQPDAAYTAFPGSNPVYDSEVMRFFYTSLTAPFSAVDYDMRTRERTLIKEQPVRGGYDRADYITERLWATAPDGVRVPMSLVYRRGIRRDGGNPALLYGYGAYEVSSDPMFDPVRLSMLDRGFVFAIAHVRGGGEMGRRWYEDGKFMNKTNTFTDFIACANHLIEQGYTSSSKLAIRGRSAGGLLIGAVLNLRPDLFACAVAQVPFVDVVTTMLDESVPLTVTEYEEWGNPNEVEYYEYMKAYSPYDNVMAAEYPAMLVTAGLNDPRVSYTEPAKWVARLRDAKQDHHQLLLQTQMGAGHSGPSGRYESWREEAFVTAFVLNQVAPEAS
ncbi:MAG TPA: S9 family peptidase [Clostridia bacterium]|nr:S9 family peptidase [Clostridia bacterium]